MESLKEKLKKYATTNPKKNLPSSFDYSKFVESKPKKGHLNDDFPLDDEYENELDEQEDEAQPDPPSPETQAPQADTEPVGGELPDMGMGVDNQTQSDDLEQTGADVQPQPTQEPEDEENKQAQVASEKISRRLESELDDSIDKIADKLNQQLSKTIERLEYKFNLNSKNTEDLNMKIDSIEKKLSGSEEENSHTNNGDINRTPSPFRFRPSDLVTKMYNRNTSPDVNANYDTNAHNTNEKGIRDTLLDY